MANKLNRNILYLDDNKQNINRFINLFRNNFNILATSTLSDALNKIRDNDISLMIIDKQLIKPDTKDFIQQVKKVSAGIIVILLARHTFSGEFEDLISKKLIYGCIQKPWHEEELKNAICNALEVNRKGISSGKKYNEEGYLPENETNYSPDFSQIVTKSKSVKSILKNIEKIALSDAPVLIQGETGTGKELIAHAIHNISPRKDAKMVKVNCPALPESLFESEIFGHEKGAFTGAVKRKTGRIELAEGGTLFLDEIGEIPMHIQSKLLRVIQQKEFERVGGESTKKANVRIIAATNRDLLESINNKEFRDDLYYRLSVFPVHLPPLRERTEDINLLADYFISKYSKQYNKKIKAISKYSLRNLLDYSWPGNIRELENVIERSVLLSNDPTLYIESLEMSSIKQEITEPVSLEEIIRKHILNILESTNWKIYGNNGAAKLLNVKPTTLQSKMIKLGIQKP
jgi:transcriptional regulator with GAF, ATPase, and Fis domain